MSETDRLEAVIAATKGSTYGRCRRCGRPHEGKGIRNQLTVYETKRRTDGTMRGQKSLWTKAVSLCSECAADGLELWSRFLENDDSEQE